MPETIHPKVGIIACSGEEIAQGTVTRLALLRVMNELRPGRTTSLCLPLFLAGDEGHRGFARRQPTIALDGCALRCAARATEQFSAAPIASFVVDDVVAEMGIPVPTGRRRLDAAGMQAVDELARRIADRVDTAMGRSPETVATTPSVDRPEVTAKSDVCSCGSGIPVSHLTILAANVEVVALPILMHQLRDAGRAPGEATTRELFELVKVYNAVPTDAEAAWIEALGREYEREAAR